MSRSRSKASSDWKDGFIFVGNDLALDFLNTRPVQNGEPLELLPDFHALLRWFQTADLLTAREAASLREQWEESPEPGGLCKGFWNYGKHCGKKLLPGSAGGRFAGVWLTG